MDNLTCRLSFIFIWLLELTEADNAPQRRFSNNTLMVAVRNIGIRCAVLRVARVLQILPVKGHGHCFVLTSSYVFQLSICFAGSRRIYGNYSYKGGKESNHSPISAHLNTVYITFFVNRNHKNE